MTIDFSTAVFLISILMGLGYVVATAERLNFWKVLLLLLVLVPFVTAFNSSKAHLYTMIAAFLFGLLFPRLRGYGFSLSFPRVNVAKLWQGLKPKPQENNQQDQFNQEKREKKRQQREQAYQKRKRESEQFRRSQAEKNKQQQSKQHSDKQEKIDQEKSQQSHQEQYNEQDNTDFNNRLRQIIRANYLEILELSANGVYSQDDIKKAYRKQANKYHPDRHQGKDEATIQSMSDKFAEVKKAYEWLLANPR